MRLIQTRGMAVEMLAMTTKIHRFLKLFSVIPRRYVRSPPDYVEMRDPKLIVLMIMAYMVASMLRGQRRQARTRMGRMLSSPTI